LRVIIPAIQQGFICFQWKIVKILLPILTSLPIKTQLLARRIFPEIESHYRPSCAYINRISFCFDFLSKRLAKIDLPKEPEALFFYGRIALLAKERVEKHFSPQWEIISNIDWPNWLNYLQQQAGKKFSLSNWMTMFHAFYEIGKLSQPYFTRLSAIKEMIFTEVSQAEDRPDFRLPSCKQT